MFLDRHDAGRALARRLAQYANRRDLLVLGVPRGGVPVAYEVALALEAPLDVVIVRKLGVPSQPELAMGAIASGDATYLNEEVIALAGVRQDQIDRVLHAEQAELRRREELYRKGRKPLAVRGRTVIVVDDGMATGASLHAAAQALITLKPAKLVIAVPVAPADGEQRLGEAVDEFVAVETPEDFRAVGQFYRQFGQTSDDEVRELLAAAAKQHKSAA